MSKPSISVIILNYNGRKLLKPCLDSVLKQSPWPNSVYVFDNASSDNSISFIKKNYPLLKVIKHLKNTGTALGSNLAFKHTSSEYVLFLSNDIILHPGCLQKLVNCLSKNPQIAQLSAQLLRPDRTIDNLGGNLDIYGFPWPNQALKPQNRSSEPVNVFFSYGGAFLIRSKVFAKVQGYDPQYFTLSDDLDLSWRIRLLGHQIAVLPSASVTHLGSATLKHSHPRTYKRFLAERNSLRTLIKNYSPASLLAILPRYLIIALLEICFFITIQFKPQLALATVKAVLWNLYHLPDTLKKRSYIQSIRQIPDSVIKQSLTPYSLKLKNYKLFL